MFGHLTSSKLAKGMATFALLGALGVGSFAVSGCGASATLDPIAKAAEVTSQQQGATFSMTMQFAAPGLPAGFSITANGEIDERNKSGRMSMDLSHIPGASSLPGGGVGTIQMIFQSPVFYMNMPSLAGKLPGGKTWMKLDLSKMASEEGIDPSQLSSLNETNPGQFLEYLRGSSGDFRDVGSETLKGVPTTHYTAILELDHVLESLPSSEQGAAKSALQALGEKGDIPVEVWVDRQGRLRRMQLSIGLNVPSSAAGAGGSASGTITMEITRYGPVRPIVPPPASEVFDASSLTGSITPG